MTHTRPIQMRPARNEDGTERVGRNGRAEREVIPQHPTRVATGKEDSTWWEDFEGEVPSGAIVREVEDGA